MSSQAVAALSSQNLCDNPRQILRGIACCYALGRKEHLHSDKHVLVRIILPDAEEWRSRFARFRRELPGPPSSYQRTKHVFCVRTFLPRAEGAI